MISNGNSALWLLALACAFGCAGAPQGGETGDEPATTKTEQAYSFGSYYGGPGGNPWTIGTPYSNILASWYNSAVGTVVESGNLTSWDLWDCWSTYPSGLRVSGQTYYANGQVLAPEPWTWYRSWPTSGIGGGLHKSHACSNGQYIIGVWGRSGGYIDTLSFICGTPDHSQIDYNNDFCGTSTGGSLFIEYCPVGMIATGFTGRGGSWLDGIQMYCNAPYVPTPIIY
jgi:hypothetical protein